MQVEIDQEALDAAYSQINYFSNLPQHIKGRVVNLYPGNDSCNSYQQQYNYNQNNYYQGYNNYNYSYQQTPGSVAHVVSGATTVINGKLNMPILTSEDGTSLS